MLTLSAHRINYLLVFILVALSGVPFFYKDPLMRPLLFLTLVISLFLFIYRKVDTDKFILIYIYIFGLISIGQFFIFDAIPLVTMLGYIIRILLAYFVIKIVGRPFISYYVNIIYFFCIVSFFFYFPTLINPGFEYFFVQNIAPFFKLPEAADVFYKATPHVIIFNFNSTLDNPMSFGIRNSGPFWEPGAFGGFALIALIFNVIKTRTLGNKKNLVFILAIITTLSTSAVIALFVLISLYYIQLSRSMLKFILAPIIVSLAWFSYYELEFLGKKITENTNNIEGGTTSNRFVSALTDLEDIKKFWVFGRGFNEETRYNKDRLDDKEKHRNNGVTAILVNIGIFGGLAYFLLIANSFKALCRQVNLPLQFVAVIMLIMLIIGFSEGYFTKVFFIALTMLHLTALPKKTHSIR